VIAPRRSAAYLAGMELDATLWLVAGGLGLAAAAILGDRARRRAPLAWHAHLPWNALAFAGLALALFGLVHVVGLLRAS
jgi:hypothetical protein